MSKSDRDQRGRRRSAKSSACSHGGGCAYCHTGEYKRPARRAERRQKRTSINEQQL